jgi:membrane associated rhomboid family serine protease
MMLTKWVRFLIVANVAAYVWSSLYPDQAGSFALVPALVLREPWTIVTYMFLHANLGHILFNMLGLFFFGPQVEQRLGGRRFLILYFVSGLSGALASIVLTPHVAIIGASAAVFGVFLAFAQFWPHAQVLIWGIIPVQARVLIVIMTVLSLLGGTTRVFEPNVAHFAHLGGFVGGWLVLRWYGTRSRASRLRQLQHAPAPPPSSAPSPASLERWKRIALDKLHPVNREEVEKVLGKAERLGAASLTVEEREFLDRISAAQ